MTDVKRLLDEATPLPWRKDSDWFKDANGVMVGHTGDCGSAWGREPWAANRRLIVYAVNALPDLEALREVTEQLVVAADPYVRHYLTSEIAHILKRLREPERVASS